MRRNTVRTFNSPLILVVTLTAMAVASNVKGAILFESGTLGPTGIPQGSVAATNVNQFVYPGVRFQITQPAITSQIGGHFVSSSPGSFFGAIIRLDDEDDFPDSNNLSTPDVLGTAALTFPDPSAEIYADLVLALDPGWYALVFGSGLFGSNGDGAAPRNNPDIGTPSYIAFEPNLNWFHLDIFQTPFNNHRFVVNGLFVPEPGTITVCSLFLFALRSFRKMK